MQDIYIVGVGMTPFGRHLDRSLRDLAADATRRALADAGLAQAELQSAVFANSVQGHAEGQHSIRGEIALRSMGIGGIPVINVENACASAATALNVAVSQLRAGEVEVALALGAEKMFSRDRDIMMRAFDGGWDVASPEENRARLVALGEGVEVPPGTTSERSYSVFMDVYAAFARFHMKTFGTTQRQIAAVAAKNHWHSQFNPMSQYRQPMTVDEVLAGAPITWPLTAPMCSPVSDGAAAAVLVSEAGMKRLGLSRDRAVRVLASVLQSGSDRSPEDYRDHLVARAAARAWERAGVGPADVSVAEVHDATAVGEIVQIEALGLCPFGDGGPMSERGETTLGGRIPVNPSGGLESRGHPVGATGLAQIFELVTQLRGQAGERQVEGARIALAENGGGLHGIEEAIAAVTILGR